MEFHQTLQTQSYLQDKYLQLKPKSKWSCIGHYCVWGGGGGVSNKHCLLPFFFHFEVGFSNFALCDI